MKNIVKIGLWRKNWADIEKEFQIICSNYNLIKDQVFREKLIYKNILENKKSHAKEEDDRNH